MSAGHPMDEDQAYVKNQASISQRLDADGQVLLKAAQQGDAATVRALLAAGLNPNAARQPGSHWSALHLAAAGGHVPAIIPLLAFGAAVDDSSAAESVTPLRLALQGQHLPAVQVLLGAGSSGIGEGLQATAGGGSVLTTLAGAGLDVSQSALAHVIGAGDFRTLKLLLQLGMPPGEECGRALVAAAGEGRLAEVEALLAAGVPADCAVYSPVWDADEMEQEMEEHEDEPCTALMAAAEGGHTAVMRCLLAAGADMEARWWTWYQNYDEPFHLTALEVCGTAEAARLLLEAGCAVQDTARDYFPLHTQIRFSNEDVVLVLLEAGADPNVAKQAENTALYYAAELDLAKAVASLLAAGADINFKSADESPLHVACSSEVALALLRAGANIHGSRNFGDTPLHCAAGSGCDGVVEVLLAAGAAVHATNMDGYTALHAAAAAIFLTRHYLSNLGRVVELLCAAGADINAADIMGHTPLVVAVYRETKAVVAALIAAGATPTTQLLTQALSHPGRRGSWMTILLPSHSISTAQLHEWAGAAFSDRRDAKQAMFWSVWALRRRLPTELLHLIAALRCMLE